jgi:two-component system NtrC family sensor kinase
LPNHRVAILIADNGKGIPQPILNKIFEPFFTTKSVGKGTGMGLPISYQVVTQNHQGNLTCESTPGVGSTFSIQIPVRLGELSA